MSAPIITAEERASLTGAIEEFRQTMDDAPCIHPACDQPTTHILTLIDPYGVCSLRACDDLTHRLRLTERMAEQMKGSGR